MVLMHALSTKFNRVIVVIVLGQKDALWSVLWVQCDVTGPQFGEEGALARYFTKTKQNLSKD